MPTLYGLVDDFDAVALWIPVASYYYIPHPRDRRPNVCLIRFLAGSGLSSTRDALSFAAHAMNLTEIPLHPPAPDDRLAMVSRKFKKRH